MRIGRGERIQSPASKNILNKPSAVSSVQIIDSRAVLSTIYNELHRDMLRTWGRRHIRGWRLS
jgi:hypothetical protein